VSPPDQDDDGAQQRTGSAEAIPGFKAPGASSVFNWRAAGHAPAEGPGDAATNHTAADAAQPPEKEEAMATGKKARRGRKASGASPQFKICAALLAHGNLDRDELLANLDSVTRAQLASALNNAKTHNRIRFEQDKFHLTKEGKDWVTGGANLDNQQPPARKPRKAAGKSAAHRRSQRRAEPMQDVDTSPPPDAEPDFRCAVMSDGAFFISKDGNVIELDADEHRRMLAYLERMAEPA
jgi:hypothetical protein